MIIISIHIGERIRHLRIYRKLSQSDLVTGICSVAYLSKVENGKARPSSKFLESISKKLDVNIDILRDKDTVEIQREVENILSTYEQIKHLSRENESLLKISIVEYIPAQLLNKVFTTLLTEFLNRDSMGEADKLYDSTINLLALDNEHAVNMNNDEKRDYQKLHSALGKYFYIKQNFNQSDHHYSIAETFIIDENHTESAQLYYNISLVKQRVLTDKMISLFYSKKAYEIFKRGHDIKTIISVLITIGVQYRYLSKYQGALISFEKAWDYLNESTITNKNELQTMIMYNIGRVYQDIGQLEKSIFYFNESLENLEDEIQKAYVLKALLEIYINKKEWSKVTQLLHEVYSLAIKYELNYMQIEISSFRATIFKKRGDYLNYEKEIKCAIEQAISENYFPIAKTMAQDLGDHYFEMRFYKKASEYFKLALKL